MIKKPCKWSFLAEYSMKNFLFFSWLKEFKSLGLDAVQGSQLVLYTNWSVFQFVRQVAPHLNGSF